MSTDAVELPEGAIDPISFTPTFTTYLGPIEGSDEDGWTARYEAGDYVKAAVGGTRGEALALLFHGLADLYEIEDGR